MARARQSNSSTSWMLTTVILGFLFVLSAILAIVFAAQIKSAQQEADEANQALLQFITKRQRTGDAQAYISRSKEDQNRGQTVFAIMQADIRALAGYLSNSDDSLAQIQTRLSTLQLPQTNLVSALHSEKQNHKDALEQLEQRDTQKKVVDASLAQLQAEKKQLHDEFVKAIAAIKTQLSRARSEYRRYRSERDSLAKKLDNHLKTVRQQTSGQVSDLTSAIEQKDQNIASLGALVSKLRDELAARNQGEDQTVVDADSKIIAVNRNDNLVYLDLTSQDRLQPGTTFEVIDRNQIVRLDRFGEVRGKATVEVVKVGPGSSVARIIRKDRNVIVSENDQLVNLAYDKNATIEFYVHGLFDLDHVGESTMADHRRLKGMIQNWGGQLAEDLNFRTDYLVLGIPPKRPEDPGRAATIQELQTFERTQAIFEKYTQLIQAATDLKIPILNQNRFLALVGYFRP